MAKDVSFSLDASGGAQILQSMMMTTIKQRSEAIAARARSMASSLSSNPPEISVTTTVGVIKRGARAIATIKAQGDDAHANYVGHIALSKSKDAGRD